MGASDLERRVAALSPTERERLAERLGISLAPLAPFASERVDPAEDRRLVAFLISRSGRELAADDLRAFLRDRLPEAMVPSAFLTLEALPRTVSGKIDRRALPALETRHRGAIHTSADPRGTRLAELWAEVLGLDAVGDDDDFFGLGGDSILLLKLCARAREQGLPLSPQAVYEHGTIAALLAAGL